MDEKKMSTNLIKGEKMSQWQYQSFSFGIAQSFDCWEIAFNIK